MTKLAKVTLAALLFQLVFWCVVFVTIAHAEPVTLKASWYSIASLKKEGTFKYSKGVMANGHNFNDLGYTCTSRMFRLGSLLRVQNIKTNKEVFVRVTDRIGKRFAQTRIDLSKAAFEKIADLKQGVITVTVEEVKGNVKL
jgi:rare lipoprotein A